MNHQDHCSPTAPRHDRCGQVNGASGAVEKPAGDDDTRLLARTLLDKTGRVVLTPDQNQAYTRYTDRILARNPNNPFDRYPYRGS